MYVRWLYLFFKILFIFIFGCAGSSMLLLLFSSFGEWRLIFAVVCGLLCSGCSCHGAWALGSRGSAAAAWGLSSCGMWAWSPQSMWILTHWTIREVLKWLYCYNYIHCPLLSLVMHNYDSFFLTKILAFPGVNNYLFFYLLSSHM